MRVRDKSELIEAIAQAETDVRSGLEHVTDGAYEDGVHATRDRATDVLLEAVRMLSAIRVSLKEGGS